jgi:hypothetical protein
MDTHCYDRSFQLCQLFSEKKQLSTLPLKPVVLEAPFNQWDLDFIGEFKDNSSNG